jgi:hypothetical protein
MTHSKIFGLSKIFFLLFCIACSNKTNLHGTWINIDILSSKYVFSEDSSFYFILKNDTMSFANDKGYSYNYNELFNTLEIIEKTSNKVFLTADVYFNGNEAILAFKKSFFSKTSKHIDEVVRITKNTRTNYTPPSTSNNIIIINHNFIGRKGISYLNTSGIKNSDTLFFSKNLIKLNEKPNPIDYAYNRFDFYFSKNNINFNEITNITKNNQLDTIDKNTICVLVEGYNQATRETLNIFFSEELIGDILTFKIDTLKNLLINNRLKKF